MARPLPQTPNPSSSVKPAEPEGPPASKVAPVEDQPVLREPVLREPVFRDWAAI